MFSNINAQAGATGVWNHGFTPTPVENQPIIRMNRDTLYSAAIVDISQGATLSIPEVGNRYVSVMVVNQDHFINRIFHSAGNHDLSMEEFETEFVMIAARILVDSENPDDISVVNDLQRQLAITSVSQREFVAPPYDVESLKSTRNSLLERGRELSGLERCFGSRTEVDPERHLIGTALGWGGLPEKEATYINVDPGLPDTHFELTVKDVPVDGFWSISLYNAEGFFEPNTSGSYSVNSVTGERNSDGSFTVNFGGSTELVNQLPIKPGWNYLIRLYLPRTEVLDGSWTFPKISN
ncbi:DUF1214 domain-containing protein [Glutamicibacter sp. Je.9.36]|uniref:DUF1214 domain-containing protein n=1 Tax=Glutamicibacter sp. Je.9.36 TaxID=3142837 RepID=UPI003DA9B11D